MTDQENVTVRNGTISGFDFGIRLERASSSAIAGVSLTSNAIFDVLARFSDNLRVRGSEIRGAGIQIQSSLAASIADTTITDGRLVFRNHSQEGLVVNCTVTDVSVSLSESDGFTVTGSTFTRSPVSDQQTNRMTVTDSRFTDAPIAVGPDSRQVVIRDNRLGGTEGSAISARVATKLRIERNLFHGNSIGVDISRVLVLDEVDGLEILNNTFVNNGAAGILLQARQKLDEGLLSIAGNSFTANGRDSGGLVDLTGRPVNDGLHVNVLPGSQVSVRDNTTQANADFGIEATPGSLIDGGGNRSTGDRSGCLGVVCS